MPEPKVDLSLLPTQDLINEIQRRFDFFVLGYQDIDPNNPNDLQFHCSKKGWMPELAIATALMFQISEHYDKFEEDGDVPTN